MAPVIAQRHDTGEAPMMAWTNREAAAETLATGRKRYRSRSWGRLWRKGKSSGQVQHLIPAAVDIDSSGYFILFDM